MNRTAAAELLRESVRIYWTLLKISLPLLVIIRVLDRNFGFVSIVGDWLSPLMMITGLPGEAGIVWATAIFLQLYAAMLVLASLWTQLDLTSAQATTLALMMLTAHALPVELRIVQKAGVRLRVMLVVRVGCALLGGILLSSIYGAGDWLQTPATLHFAPPPVNPSWESWGIGQLKNWSLIYIVILVLVVFVRILKVTHAERVIAAALSPFLRRMGIGERATTTTLIGMTLGLSYGGALLIDESRRGDIGRRDMLCALALVSICHSVIEDTLAMLLIGGHISGVLFARVIFSFLFMAAFAKMISYMSDDRLSRWMLR